MYFYTVAYWYELWKKMGYKCFAEGKVWHPWIKFHFSQYLPRGLVQDFKAPMAIGAWGTPKTKEGCWEAHSLAEHPPPPSFFPSGAYPPRQMGSKRNETGKEHEGPRQHILPHQASSISEPIFHCRQIPRGLGQTRDTLPRPCAFLLHVRPQQHPSHQHHLPWAGCLAR